ncbi:hypothetical protein BJ170DRAFT_594571 [Xylariales sp. AK1849]|nr:hypothetical protein BJ170DRAFT_594571 [Xylariales sp. AK1849]
MFPRWPSLRALLCLMLCLQVVAAGLLGPVRRQNSLSISTVAPTATEEANGDETTTTSPARTEESTSSLVTSTDIKTASSVTGTSTTATTASAVPTALNGNTAANITGNFNSTIVEGELPIEPRLTPGWIVAGVILLITGAVYVLIGIKSTWLQSFLSTAYLVGLSTAVLIVYVMAPPVSDGIQGAYVVACVCTGLVLGGGATVFKEMTEGLGCLLGGFCLSMWFLTLREGGLIASSTGRIIFITAMTLCGFAFYFSRWTRTYALIGFISFSGATVTVLGIDCFSRAGLKEFWAYIWNLNDNLFPLDADTYPLTKGIRVEIALNVIICIIGIISQMRLWRVIQAHKAKRAEAQAEAQRQLDVEEANVGQQIEHRIVRERREWEKTYGNHPGSPAMSGDSGFGDMHEKKVRYSQTTMRGVSTYDNENAVELVELPSSILPVHPALPANPKADGLDLPNAADESRGTVQLARDDEAPNSTYPEPVVEEKVWLIGGAGGEARPASQASVRNSQRLSRSTAPQVSPLSFQIPQRSEGKDDDDRSSFATIADEDDRSIVLGKRASRASLGNRLSVGSGHLLRSISRGSIRSANSKRRTADFSPQLSPTGGESREDLVLEEQRMDEDTGSIAATMDGMSADGNRAISETGGPTWTMEITAELAERSSQGESGPDTKSVHHPKLEVRPYSTAEIDNVTKTEGATETGTSVSGGKSSTPQPSASATPLTDLTSGSLTRDRLPQALPRVASVYRTNEWAKRLSKAEVPELDVLRWSGEMTQEVVKEDEPAAPVNLEDLKLTAENGHPAPALARSPSSLSSSSPPASGLNSRSNPRPTRSPPTAATTKTSGLTVPTSASHELSVRTSPGNAFPPPPLHGSRSFRIKSGGSSRRTSTDIIAQPIVEEYPGEFVTARTSAVAEYGLRQDQPSSASPEQQQANSRAVVPRIVSYSSPQTLLGRREMLLSHKSSMIKPATPEAGAYVPQPSGSDPGSLHDYPMHDSFLGQDADDMPLSQRKQLMRHNSLLSLGAGGSRPGSNIAQAYVARQSSSPVDFNSHQPQRRSTLPSQAAREAQLASFRQSVAQDTRPGVPVIPVMAGNFGQARTVLQSQREQEAHRKGLERWEKERNDLMFQERIRSSGQFLDAHRDAMRRMQSAVKDR